MSSLPARFSVLSATLALTACASGPRVAAEWRDASLGTQSRYLSGATVLIACESPDLAVRSICQQQLANAVGARGARPILAPADTSLLTDRAIDGQLLSGARASNAKAVLVLGIAPVASEPSSGLSIGIGGFGFGRNSAIGGGISAPLVTGPIVTGFGANGRVTDVASGRVIYTASAASEPSADLNAQFAELSRAVLDAAARAGLF